MGLEALLLHYYNYPYTQTEEQQQLAKEQISNNDKFEDIMSMSTVNQVYALLCYYKDILGKDYTHMEERFKVQLKRYTSVNQVLGEHKDEIKQAIENGTYW